MLMIIISLIYAQRASHCPSLHFAFERQRSGVSETSRAGQSWDEARTEPRREASPTTRLPLPTIPNRQLLDTTPTIPCLCFHVSSWCRSVCLSRSVCLIYAWKVRASLVSRTRSTRYVRLLLPRLLHLPSQPSHHLLASNGLASHLLQNLFSSLSSLLPLQHQQTVLLHPSFCNTHFHYLSIVERAIRILHPLLIPGRTTQRPFTYSSQQGCVEVCKLQPRLRRHPHHHITFYTFHLNHTHHFTIEKRVLIQKLQVHALSILFRVRRLTFPLSRLARRSWNTHSALQNARAAFAE